VRWFEDLTSEDVPSVGGKNASLGELIGALGEKGVRVPGGFATTARAYWTFLEANDIEDEIRGHLEDLHNGTESLQTVGKRVRRLFRRGEFPGEVAESIQAAYRRLSERYEVDEVDVAARSSATAEDLPEASFAGQQETFLNVTGEEELLDACRKCYASLFTDRAIAYREEQGFDHMQVALSVGVQKMVRSDKACAGVMFTIDTETGFPDVVVINGSWGLGDTVVQGTIIPDEYRAFKPLLEQENLRPSSKRRWATRR
jgi:pyruvate,water dikinase